MAELLSVITRRRRVKGGGRDSRSERSMWLLLFLLHRRCYFSDNWTAQQQNCNVARVARGGWSARHWNDRVHPENMTCLSHRLVETMPDCCSRVEQNKEGSKRCRLDTQRISNKKSKIEHSLLNQLELLVAIFEAPEHYFTCIHQLSLYNWCLQKDRVL